MLLVKCAIDFFVLFFKIQRESLLVDKNVVPDMMFVVNVSAKFLMYLLASETRNKLALGLTAKFLSQKRDNILVVGMITIYLQYSTK